jgi:pimeloyl-ACP methyl ester carboxylesterase
VVPDIRYARSGDVSIAYQVVGEGRLIIFDKRGTGLSDRVAGVADLETRMDDIRAVMDAAGSEAAAVCGVSEGGPMAVLFAATYPERVRALVIYGSLPRFVRGPGFPWAEPKHEYLAEYAAAAEAWATEENAREWLESQGQEVTPETVRERARRDVAGSGIEFLDRGAAAVEGVPGEWMLYAVASTG